MESSELSSLASPSSFTFACSLATLKSEGRYHFTTPSKRVLTIFFDPLSDSVRAIDAICYHAGGPLTIGDIEDIDGHACVLCPWHNQPIRLSDGAYMYRKVSFVGPTMKMVHDENWSGIPMMQRVFPVEIRGDDIYVDLEETGQWKSDKYAGNEDAAKNIMKRRRRE